MIYRAIGLFAGTSDVVFIVVDVDVAVVLSVSPLPWSSSCTAFY